MSKYTKDIFISYSRQDNKKNIISIFLESLWDSMQHHVGRVPPFFLDTADINTGDEWESKLLQTVDTCRLLIAFLSPSYFRSSYCIKEWKRMHKRNYTAIFPVTLIPYQPADTPLKLGQELNAEQTKVFNQANDFQNLNWFNVQDNKQEEELKKFSFLIHNKLIQETDLKDQLPRDNHHIIDESIEENLNDSKKGKITKTILEVNQKRKFNHEPVCVIYT
ncbi:Toll-Interleukin receptor domain protein, partial [Candidatus Magnetomorum sp. HK-1]